MHPAIIFAITRLLFFPIAPANESIAKLDPGFFDPPAEYPAHEKEIPADVVCNVATLVVQPSPNEHTY